MLHLIHKNIKRGVLNQMSTLENKENEIPSEKKKISLEEAIKRKLAGKKQGNSLERSGNYSSKNKPTMKSQQTKKANNQRRRTGV